MPPHHEFLTMKFTSRMTRTPPHTTSTHSLAQSFGLLREFIDEHAWQGVSFDHRNHQAVPQSLFAKKKDGTLQLCVDFRNLNKITPKDRYPIPPCHQPPRPTGQCKRSTLKLDLRAGYYNVRVAAGHDGKQPSGHAMAPSNSWSCRWGSPTLPLRSKPS